jgi:hypothetical protein
MAHVPTNRLTISIDGDEVSPDVSTVEVVTGESESDFISFAQAAQGGARTYSLHLVLAQDMATGSVWRQIWDAAGSEVDVVVRPYGNAVASATQPHIEGTVVIVEPDGPLLGGAADPSATAVLTVDVTWQFLAKPDMVSA